MLQISFKVRSELGTSVLTDVVMSAVAVHVVPEVITEDRAADVLYKVISDFWHQSYLLLRKRKDLQEGVVVFPESEAVLVVAKVVRLPVVPVEPGNLRWKPSA